MTGFIGEYNCKLDAKGRLSLPVGLRKQLDPVDQEQFVVNRGLSGNLNLFPLSEWIRVMDKLRQLNRFNSKNLKFSHKIPLCTTLWITLNETSIKQVSQISKKPLNKGT